jgi:CheY-like chemotaxis protein
MSALAAEQIRGTSVHHRVIRAESAARSGIVLVVDEDDEAREALAGVLVDEGYSVLTCAGPLPPACSCPGGDAEKCPFAPLADAVVLDLRSEADTLMEGVPDWQLLAYYSSLGKPVVALSEDPLNLSAGDRVVVLRGRPDGREIASELRRLMSHAGDVFDLGNQRRRAARRHG